MNRGILVLAIGLLAGAVSEEVCFRERQAPDPGTLDGQLAWMKSELGLTNAQYARIRELHEESSPRLRALAVQVTQMKAEFAAFERTRQDKDQVDFIEFARFVETRRAIDRACLDSTRRLVMATAGEMTPAQRAHYLGIVAATAPQTGFPAN